MAAKGRIIVSGLTGLCICAVFMQGTRISAGMPRTSGATASGVLASGAPVSGALASGAPAATLTASDVPAAPKGKVVFFDDFSGASLDRSKWNAEVTGMHVNNELQAYVDSNSTIYLENNALVLRPQYARGYVTKDGQHFDFVSGRINTRDKFDFKYGTAEARIKLTEGAGLWPAWWMLGNGEWPATGELDIMEYVGEQDWASAAVHGPGYSGETPFVNRTYFNRKNSVTQWHIYALDWTPDSLVFKYDGAPMFRVTRTMTDFYGKWAFDTNKFLVLNFAVGGIYPAKINGIQKPYYGLASSSLDQIKSNHARMWVDWVRVTQN